MAPLDLYAVVVTDRLFDCRDFWVRHFGFAPLFQASWFVLLRSPEPADSPRLIAFMHPDHPSRPPGPEAFGGTGLFMTVQVADAAAAHAKLAAAGAPIDYGPADEPWGQRRFMTRDPSGLMVDVVEQTEPAAGWWDRYLVA